MPVKVNPPRITGLKVVYKDYKRNAKIRNLVFALSVKEFVTLTQQDCAYCGSRPNSIAAGNPRDYKSEDTYINSAYVYNGIDRLDNSEGYVLHNCAPCCSICNHAKATMTLAEFYNWIDRLTNNRRA